MDRGRIPSSMDSWGHNSNRSGAKSEPRKGSQLCEQFAVLKSFWFLLAMGGGGIWRAGSKGEQYIHCIRTAGSEKADEAEKVSYRQQNKHVPKNGMPRERHNFIKSLILANNNILANNSIGANHTILAIATYDRQMETRLDRYVLWAKRDG